MVTVLPPAAKKSAAPRSLDELMAQLRPEGPPTPTTATRSSSSAGGRAGGEFNPYAKPTKLGPARDRGATRLELEGLMRSNAELTQRPGGGGGADDAAPTKKKPARAPTLPTRPGAATGDDATTKADQTRRAMESPRSSVAAAAAAAAGDADADADADAASGGPGAVRGGQEERWRRSVVERAASNVGATASQLAATYSLVPRSEKFDFADYEGVEGGEERARALGAVLPLNDRQRVRRVVREGTLRKGCRGGPRPYFFVLFCDALVLAHGAPDVAVVVNRELPLALVVTKDHPDGAPNGFSVCSMTKSFSVLAATAAEAAGWRAAIDRAAASSRRRDDGADVSPPDESTLAPIWRPYRGATACELCGAPFSFLRRRHHCRRCGRLCCHACSTEKLRLPNSAAAAVVDPDTKAASFLFQRACRLCHSAHADTRTYGVDRTLSWDAKMSRKNVLQSRWRSPPRDEDDENGDDDGGGGASSSSSPELRRKKRTTSSLPPHVGGPSPAPPRARSNASLPPPPIPPPLPARPAPALLTRRPPQRENAIPQTTNAATLPNRAPTTTMPPPATAPAPTPPPPRDYLPPPLPTTTLSRREVRGAPPPLPLRGAGADAAPALPRRP